jgi:hypothetical protein
MTSQLFKQVPTICKGTIRFNYALNEHHRPENELECDTKMNFSGEKLWSTFPDDDDIFLKQVNPLLYPKQVFKPSNTFLNSRSFLEEKYFVSFEC